ncbi:MAG: hypothetical protein U5N85_17470 [Arcicella sp.]|nr:hypothetical protein [Arcicella sp.]
MDINVSPTTPVATDTALSVRVPKRKTGYYACTIAPYLYAIFTGSLPSLMSSTGYAKDIPI